MGKNNSLTRDFDKDEKIFDYHCVRGKNFLSRQSRAYANVKYVTLRILTSIYFNRVIALCKFIRDYN